MPLQKNCFGKKTELIYRVKSGKYLSSKFGRKQYLYWTKRYTSRKPLISALIWHPKSGCGITGGGGGATPSRREKHKSAWGKKNYFRTGGQGSLMIMPNPLLGYQIKAKIKCFLLVTLFLWDINEQKNCQSFLYGFSYFDSLSNALTTRIFIFDFWCH